MTTEQFREFTEEVIPQQLFHVDSTDLDDDTGASLEEVILIRLIANDLSCLKHKPLDWFIESYIHSYRRAMEKQKGELTKNQIEEMEMFRQIQEDERSRNEKVRKPDTRTYDEKIQSWMMVDVVQD